VQTHVMSVSKATDQHNPKRRRRIIGVIMICALLVLATPMFVAGSIWSYGLTRAEPTGDAAIVLGAAIHGTEPSPIFRERINHGLQLYKSGKVKKLILTGGVEEEGGLAESEVARNYAIKKGVPPGDLLIETVSKTTFENLQQARGIARENHLRTLVVVSDPIHMKRAMTMAASIGLPAKPSPTPTTKFHSWPSRSRFLAHETYYYITFQIEHGLGRI